MENREGGHGEKKDQSYFEQEINRLAEEAKSNGQKELAVVLYSLNGAMKGGAMKEFTKLSAEFSMEFRKKMQAEIDSIKKTPKN